jgi:cation:H+ antiporter
MLIAPLIFIASAILLIKSSEWVVTESIRASRLFGISTFTIGFIIISISTSLPELSVAIFSTLEGVPSLSVGNLFGANLTDLTLILGLCAIFGGPLFLEKRDLEDLIELLFVVSLVTLLILYNPQPSPLTGIVLLALFGLLIVRLYRKGKIPRELFDGAHEKKTVALGKLIVGLILLLLAAHFLVDSALEISQMLNLSPTLFGATAVALSTTLPELTVELRAIRKKDYALALGDLFGSAVTNITLVLGIVILGNINMPNIDIAPVLGLLPFLFLVIFILWYMLSRKEMLDKLHGIILIGIYIIYLLEEFNFFAFLK